MFNYCPLGLTLIVLPWDIHVITVLLVINRLVFERFHLVLTNASAVVLYTQYDAVRQCEALL